MTFVHDIPDAQVCTTLHELFVGFGASQQDLARYRANDVTGMLLVWGS